MAKEIKYICNFCRSARFDSTPIMGAHWRSVSILALVAKENAENHICMACVLAIKAAEIPETIKASDAGGTMEK